MLGLDESVVLGPGAWSWCLVLVLDPARINFDCAAQRAVFGTGGAEVNKLSRAGDVDPRGARPAGGYQLDLVTL